MYKELEQKIKASKDPASLRVEEEIVRIKTQTKDADNRLMANVLDRFWQGVLNVPEDVKLNLALQIKETNGNISIRTIEEEQVQTPDRKDPLWKGTVVDSGADEAFITVTKIGQDNAPITTWIRVSPFSYKTLEGKNDYKLKPDAITRDDPMRGAMFRNKASILE